MGNTGEKKKFVCLGLFFHAAVLVRGGTCAFTLKICQHADQKQLTRRLAFDLDIEAIHRQPASCRARLKNVDDDLQDIRWIPDLGGKEAARGVLRSSPSPDKRSFLAIG